MQFVCAVSFGYSDGPNGPDHWGELKPEWALCKSGFQQSPLAITPALIITDSTLGDLKANYTSNPVNVTISHDGQDLKVAAFHNLSEQSKNLSTEIYFSCAWYW